MAWADSDRVYPRGFSDLPTFDMVTPLISLGQNSRMLFGRDQEMAQIDQALGESRLVTVTGPGGVGKTALARAFAASSPMGAAIAELAALGPSDLGNSVAGSLGFASYDELAEHLGDGGNLLVLDNCEHVLDAAAELVDSLLTDCPGLSILATSRERLDLPDELVIRIGPLSVEGPDSPAVAMFNHVAARVGSPVSDHTTVATLVGRLDGLPLAIELAAARSASVDPGLMLEHLAARIDLISRSRARGADRHLSLEAAIGWSYQLLDQEQRRIFEHLGVLPARFDLEMAAAAAGVEPAAVLEPLADLVERSLVVHEPASGVSWYRMLETIRLFAREKLAGSGSGEEAETRVLDHLGGWADAWVSDGMRVEGAALRRLDTMFRSLYWGVERALLRDDEDLAHRLVAPLWWLEDVGYQGEAAELLERVIERWSPTGDEGMRSRRLHTAGIAASLHRIAGRLDRAAEIAESVIEGGEGLGAAYAHRVLGHMSRSAGEWESALHHFRAGAAAASDHGDVGLSMEIRMHEAMTHARSGDLDQGVAILEELRDASGSYRQLHSWVSLFLAWLLLFRDPSRTETMAREIAEMADSHGDLWAEAAARVNLAAVILARGGDHRVAADLVAGSLERYHRIGNRTDIRLSYLIGAAAVAASGDRASADRLVATGMWHYTTAVFGEVEKTFFADQGVDLEVDPSTPRISAEEALALLQKIASDEQVQTPDETGAAWFRCEGDFWDVGYRGRGVKVAHSKGMTDLARVLARPGVEIAAVDLMDAGIVEEGVETADAQARRAYRKRVLELREAIENASLLGDDDAVARAQDELDALMEQLSSDYGIGGRARQLGSTAERARTAVTWRIRSAIRRIGESHPELAAHLDRSVRTGRFCSYQPEIPIVWDVRQE